MVVDSSAIVAILYREDRWRTFITALGAAERRSISAATLVEVGIVIEARRGEAGAAVLDRLLARFRIEIVPFDAAQAELAREAFRRFGRGRHPAGLNVGDCFAYALARQLEEPLLFKGDDFARTDVTAAIAP